MLYDIHHSKKSLMNAPEQNALAYFAKEQRLIYYLAEKARVFE
jgi:hypothetical protein